MLMAASTRAHFAIAPTCFRPLHLELFPLFQLTPDLYSSYHAVCSQRTHRRRLPLLPALDSTCNRPHRRHDAHREAAAQLGRPAQVPAQQEHEGEQGLDLLRLRHERRRRKRAAQSQLSPSLTTDSFLPGSERTRSGRVILIQASNDHEQVRYVVHRGFVNERRKDGDGSQNLVSDDNQNDLISDKLVVTTDARSPKARQLAAQPKIELAWWMAATQHQFRILGNAYILPSAAFPRHDSTEPKSGATSTAEPGKISFPFPEKELGPYDGFSWEDERIRQFRKMSPELRASFYRPVPGTDLADSNVKMEDLPETLPEGVQEAEGDEQKKQVQEGKPPSQVVFALESTC